MGAGEPTSGSGSAAAEAQRKRKRGEPEQEDNSACQRDAKQHRTVSGEPGLQATDQVPTAAQDVADSGREEPFGDTDLGLSIVEDALAAACVAITAAQAKLASESLPMAVDPPSPASTAHDSAEGAAEPAAAAAAPAAEEAQHAEACTADELAAAEALPPAPSKQESALLPQCAIMTGPVAEAAEVSTRHCGKAPSPVPASQEPSERYLALRAELSAGLISPEQAGVPWDRFPHYLGEGVRSRLLALATLHLRPGASAPAAVKALPANSNRVLLGAATSCELYQERVIRALAQKVGATLLVADAYSLKLDEMVKEDGGEDCPSSGGPADPFDLSDEEEPGLGLGHRAGERGRREPGPSSGRSKQMDRLTRGIPRMVIPLTGPRPPPGSLAAAVMAATAAADAAPGGAKSRDAVAVAAAATERLKRARAAAAAADAAAGRGKAANDAKEATAMELTEWIKGALAVEFAAEAADAAPGGADAARDAKEAAATATERIKSARARMAALAAANPRAAAAAQPPTSPAAAAEQQHADVVAEGGGKQGRRPAAAAAAEPAQAADQAVNPSAGHDAAEQQSAVPAGTGASAVLPPSVASMAEMPAAVWTEYFGKACGYQKVLQSTSVLGRPSMTNFVAACPQPAGEHPPEPTLERSASASGLVPRKPPHQQQEEPEARLAAAAGAAAAAQPAAGEAAAAAATGAAATAPQSSAFMAAACKVSMRPGDRVTYVGEVHPSQEAAAQRLDQLHAAISQVEGSSSLRARDYLPQLLLRRSLVEAQGQRLPRQQGAAAPPIGSRGRVLAVTGNQVQVVFDEEFGGGTSLAGQKEKCGLTCVAEELLVVEDKEDPLVSSLQCLFDVAAQEAGQGRPLIIFIQNLDRLLRTHATDHFRKLEALLAALPPCCLLFGAYCSRALSRSEAKKEGGGPNLSRLFGSLGGGDTGMGGGGGGASEDMTILDRLGKGAGRGPRKSVKGKALSKMLPNLMELHPPNQDCYAKAWAKMVEADVAVMRQRSNRAALRAALLRCGCTCDNWDAVSITDCQLTRREIEQVVGVAAAQQLLAESSAAEAGEPAGANAPAAAPKGTQPADPVPAAAKDLSDADSLASAPALALERSGSVCEAPPTAAIGAAPAGAAAAAAPAAAEQRGQQQQQPAATAPGAAAAALAASDQVTTMQTDEVDGGTAAAAAVPAPPYAAEKVAPLWTLAAEHIMHAAEAIRKVQAEGAAAPANKLALKDVAADQYEKQLLSEIIPPEEIAVSFDDIGALEAVKTTLHEVVILPLQRPELFTRGALTKPTKGLLLFGPPGTGKTMLAKAVASESGAHFINVNMSAITSKWFGEGERLVRALFALAHKLSPSVIFVDEIDSFLSKRGQSNSEHEALRKMKNEFMTHWDGLRTKQSDRVLVLAATNRPMDLDEAVVRRMPRRIFVPLPDAANRERILQVILKDEDLHPAFDFSEAATLADGYSGSDLKNLCIAAAYCPIREYLEAERAAKAAERAAAKAAGGVGAGAREPCARAAAAAAAAAIASSSATPAALASVSAAAVVAQPVLRQITMADFKAALKQVTASTTSDSATMEELRRWNDQYGEGGTRSKEHLPYFM